MRHLLITAFLLSAAAGCGCPPCENEAGAAPAVHVLFDGGSTDGWKMAGPGAFRLEDGELVAEGGMGLFWYGGESFADFRLELEWKTEDATDNSGVFVRFPDPQGDPWIAVNQGYEVQICDESPPDHRTGSIYSFADGEPGASKGPGEWNHYAITVRGQEYEIVLNGRTVCRFTGERSTEGYVGLQNHDDGSPVRFRNIRVTELAPES